MSELKPVAYIHYWMGGSPPDDYVEGSELLTPFEVSPYKDMESNVIEGIEPLYAIPEGYALVSIEHIEQAASDNNNRSVSWRKSTMRLFGQILRSIEASKAEK